MIASVLMGCASNNNAATTTSMATATTLAAPLPSFPAAASAGQQITTTTLAQAASSTSTTQAAASTGKSYPVNIQNFKFTPDSLVIASGDTVVWQNLDSATHAIASDNGELNSDMLAKGGVYSYTFVNKGTYDYHCKVHPAMKGIIIVR